MLFSHPVFHITDRVFCRVCIFRFYKRINSLLNYFLTCWILHPSSYFDILVHLSSLVSSVFCKLLFLLLCRIKCLCRSLPAFFFFTPCIFIFVWRLSVCSAVCLGKPVYLDSFWFCLLSGPWSLSTWVRDLYVRAGILCLVYSFLVKVGGEYGLWAMGGEERPPATLAPVYENHRETVSSGWGLPVSGGVPVWFCSLSPPLHQTGPAG